MIKRLVEYPIRMREVQGTEDGATHQGKGCG